MLRKETVPWCIKTIFQSFHAESVQKISQQRIKLLNVTSVNFELILNETISIIKNTNNFKTVMNPGIA